METHSDCGDNREHQHNVIGYRLCAKCGYQLTGQRIAREKQYDMLIIRCPECATVAAIQEQPILARWANRWGYILAAAWIILTLALLVGGTAAISGLALGAGEIASIEFSSVISAAYEAYEKSKPVGTTSSQGYPGGFYGSSVSVWWETQNPGEILKKSGGFFSNINHYAFLMWIPLGLCIFLYGTTFSVILSNWTRIKLVIFLIVSWVALLGWCWTFSYQYDSYIYSSWGIASSIIAPTFMYLSIVFAAIVLLPSVMYGRSLARVLIRLFLPPRMQASLSGLWITDGKEPPSFPSKK